MTVETAVPPPAPPPGAPRPAPLPGTARSRLRADFTARWLVTAGGLAIIASILGILIFLVLEVLPLVGGARVSPGRRLPLDGPAPGAVVTDEYRTLAATLALDGRLRVREIASGRTVLERDVAGGTALSAVSAAPGEPLLVAATGDGRVLALRVGWNVSFDGDRRVVEARLAEPVAFPMDPAGRPLGAFTARIDEAGAGAAAALLVDGSLVVVRRRLEKNLFTEQTSEAWERLALEAPPGLRLLLLDGARRNLYGGAADGALVCWILGDGAPGAPVADRSERAAVTALSLLIGDWSLVVGREDGSLAVWSAVRHDDARIAFARIHAFPSHSSPIVLLAPSARNKGFLAHDAAGGLALVHSTSERVLWAGPTPLPDATALHYAPKADGALVAGPGGIAELSIANPHPEVSLRALFGKIWYEGHGAPAYVWQSSGGSDDFEPKLSLVPLLIGTLKGTLYSLLFAIPLGVLGALYTAHFMHPSLKRYVKPTVEIMAALPSVVLGFLAGLWLAPRVERIVPALLLMQVVLPALVVSTGFAWRALPLAVRGRFRAGSEFVLYMVALATGFWLCLEWNAAFEAAAFGGDFQRFLLDLTGLRYDQRNAIVVGLAMGFAVIPIIFSIAEDAFSNVPQSLVSASLALGASRWQTAMRVILPTASPGIFSAIMIGFGRAVGETMIVLMATGNTPVLDWNPWNGFRTLSANVAVEIPEAAQGGTLYRTLFLAALLLFAITFAVNTAAEVVRLRLRRRFGQA